MSRPITLTTILILFCASPVFAQINKSKEFSGVYHSPAADATPKIFHSILQMEIVVKIGDADAQVKYANGTVVSSDGLIVSVLADPSEDADEARVVQSATVLTLDGSSVAAEFIAYERANGVAIFRVQGLDRPALQLSKSTPVAQRRIMWHAVYRNGRRTYLYSRPLSIHNARHPMADSEEFCQIIDKGSSSLNADRSGSALVALDGTLVGIMGRQEHWNITPKTQSPRTKTAWAIPAHVIARLLEQVSGRE